MENKKLTAANGRPIADNQTARQQDLAGLLCYKTHG
jgi:hypothetical protein